MIELSKSQKKIANSLEWKTGDLYELYLELYKKVTSFNRPAPAGIIKLPPQTQNL
jgi:hypothetical protein